MSLDQQLKTNAAIEWSVVIVTGLILWAICHFHEPVAVTPEPYILRSDASWTIVEKDDSFSVIIEPLHLNNNW